MDFKALEEKKTISVFSNRIGEILVTEFGLKTLVNIAYLPSKTEGGKSTKVYVFRNSPELLKMFMDYAYSEKKAE